MSTVFDSANLLEQYFAEVLGYTLDLSGVVFPEKDGFVTYMAVSQTLTKIKSSAALPLTSR